MNGLMRHMLTQLGFDCWDGVGHVVGANSQKPASTPLAPGEIPTSQNPGSTQDVMGLHHVVFVRLEGQMWLADVGLGGQGQVEPIPVKAHDEEGGGEWAHGGSCHRLRRGVLGSVEALPADSAQSHPEADSHVGWYAQASIKVGSKTTQRNMAPGQWMEVCAMDGCLELWMGGHRPIPGSTRFVSDSQQPSIHNPPPVLLGSCNHTTKRG